MAFARRDAGLYKTPGDLARMVRPGLLTFEALSAARAAAKPGVTTLELDAIAERVIRDGGGEPNFAKVPGYRHTLCVSVNEEVVHGIPGERVLEAGDIVSIDCGAEVEGWNGDSATTVIVPGAPEHSTTERRLLSEATERSLWAGIAAFASARHVNDVGTAIESSIRASGDYGILREYIGHGIGRQMHEDPPVFNYRVRKPGPPVKAGLVLAIEPMITAGGIATLVAEDDWTVVTSDGSDASHWEHSVARHAGGIWVLTSPDGGAAALAEFGVDPVPIPGA